MAQFSWSFDAPTGTYKQNALSQKLYIASVQMSKFVEFTRPVDGYGKKMGENVTLTRVSNMTEPTSAVLQEGVRIPEDAFSISTRSITAQELGRSVPYTSLSEDFSRYDLENPIQMKLRQQLTLTLDALAATAFKACQVKYEPTGALSNATDTGGTATTTATSNMNVFHVEQIRDLLKDTYYADPYEGDDYVGIFRVLGLRGIKRDVNWEDWHRYTDPQAKYNGEVGRIEGVRFVETNHSTALSKTGTGSVLGEGVVFGADPVVLAEVMTPELRAAQPQDFGRSKAIAWYGVLAFGEVWNTSNAGEARIIHVTSA